MGTSDKGLTEIQKAVIEDYQSRAKPLTIRQAEELARLIHKRDFIPDLSISEGCQSSLIKMYCLYEKGKMQSSYIGMDGKMMKGVQSEADAIELIEKQIGTPICVDKTRIENDFLVGKLDGFIGDCIENADRVIDIKCSWDLPSFYKSIINELPDDYEYQMQGYMAITGANEADVYYVLLNTPEAILDDEYKKLRIKMHTYYDDPYFLSEKEKVRQFHTYDDLPISERICRFTVFRDDEKISKIHHKVIECRKWLKNFHNIVLSKRI